VPEVVSQIVRGASEIRLGNLFPTRDFVDLTTQSRAIVDAHSLLKGPRRLNIGSGIPTEVADMVDIIIAESGRHARIVLDPTKARAVERPSLSGTTNRLKNLIGYIPEPAGRATIQAILREALEPESGSRLDNAAEAAGNKKDVR
jgi:UDP-glucose 4-epimerase